MLTLLLSVKTQIIPKSNFLVFILRPEAFLISLTRQEPSYCGGNEFILITNHLFIEKGSHLTTFFV